MTGRTTSAAIAERSRGKSQGGGGRLKERNSRGRREERVRGEGRQGTRKEQASAGGSSPCESSFCLRTLANLLQGSNTHTILLVCLGPKLPDNARVATAWKEEDEDASRVSHSRLTKSLCLS